MSSRYGLTIRATTAADLEGVGELLRDCGVTVPAERVLLNMSAMRHEPGVLLLAEEWGPPTGLIAVHWAASLTAELKVAYVTQLLVAPDRRRTGVARLLLKAASQAARAAGCGDLILTAAADQDGLQAFALVTGCSQQGVTLRRPLRKHG